MTHRVTRFGIFAAVTCAVFAITLQPNTTAAAINLKSGAVYVLTNQVSNAVAAFDRAPDGTLTSVGEFSTGGSGNPVAQPGDPPTDPLASQGALLDQLVRSPPAAAPIRRKSVSTTMGHCSLLLRRPRI